MYCAGYVIVYQDSVLYLGNMNYKLLALCLILAVPWIGLWSITSNCVISWSYSMFLTLNVPIATIVVCFSRLLKCLRSLFGKQCGPRSDCCLLRYLIRRWCKAIICSRRLWQTTFSDAFLLGALRVNHSSFQIHFVSQMVTFTWIFSIQTLMKIWKGTSGQWEDSQPPPFFLPWLYLR